MLLRRLSPALTVGCLLAFVPSSAQAQIIWNLGTGGSWNTAANWNPATVPNGTDVIATFNDAASGSNPAQTANRTITVDAAQTVGTINFNNDAANAFTNSLTTGTAGSLTFSVGAGSATINVPAVVGTGNNTISAPMILTSNLVANVNNTTASSLAGALNLTATITGAGGFTKNGDGLATYGTGTKTYTGPTFINGGRIRISSAAQASATSSFTINAGGQVDFITAGTFNMGGTVLNLNGAGPTTGPFAAFPGAIRPDTGLAIVISTPSVVLQSDTVVQSQGSAGGSIALQGNIIGPGMLSFTPPTSFDANLGRLILSGTGNTYGAGTTVNGGTVEVTAGSSLGAGKVTVKSANAVFGGAQAHLQIDGTGLTNAISDSAILSLAGGNVAGVADDGYIDLSSGANEVVGGLILGGVTQAPGVYSSITSPEFILGSGTIIVSPVPEPGSMALVGLAVAGLGVRLIRRKKVAAG
jgi:autotransporter-associated beta strand protein